MIILLSIATLLLAQAPTNRPAGWLILEGPETAFLDDVHSCGL